MQCGVLALLRHHENSARKFLAILMSYLRSDVCCFMPFLQHKHNIDGNLFSLGGQPVEKAREVVVLCAQVSPTQLRARGNPAASTLHFVTRMQACRHAAVRGRPSPCVSTASAPPVLCFVATIAICLAAGLMLYSGFVISTDRSDASTLRPERAFRMLLGFGVRSRAPWKA